MAEIIFLTLLGCRYTAVVFFPKRMLCNEVQPANPPLHCVTPSPIVTIVRLSQLAGVVKDVTLSGILSAVMPDLLRQSGIFVILSPNFTFARFVQLLKAWFPISSTFDKSAEVKLVQYPNALYPIDFILPKYISFSPKQL